MNSAIRLILGLSILATAAGCDTAGEGEESNGPKAVAGTTSVLPGGTNAGGTSSGTGGTDAGGTGTAMLPEGVPLTAADGWVDAASNTLGVQGAMFAYADDTS